MTYDFFQHSVIVPAMRAILEAEGLSDVEYNYLFYTLSSSAKRVFKSRDSGLYSDSEIRSLMNREILYVQGYFHGFSNSRKTPFNPTSIQMAVSLMNHLSEVIGN